MSSAILAAKPIKSWYEAVVEEEETTKQSQVQTDSVKYWVDTLSKSLELLLALQQISQQTSSDKESPTGSISKPLSKPQTYFPQKPLLACFTNSTTKLFQI